MRLIRLTTNYPAYLTRFYSARRESAQKPYAKQYAELVADAFGWADFWTEALSGLGYEVWEPIANAESMQKQWAQENASRVDPTNWMHDIVVAQVAAFRPDVVFIDDYGAFNAQFVRRLRDAAPSIRLILGWCAAPYSDESVFSEYDVLLTSIPGVAEHFRQRGLKTEVMNHAFHPAILDRLNLRHPKQFEFTFVGSVRLGQD
jgi:spore maturation protein CgeB